MNQLSTDTSKKSKQFHPIKLLKSLSDSQADGHLQVFYNSVSWLIYFEQGKLTYATHSVEPFERLERHLRRLSNENKNLTDEIRTQVRLKFETDSSSYSTPNSDYQAICWLVEQEYINSTEAAKLAENLTREVFETYLLLQEGTYKFAGHSNELPIFCHLNLSALIERCHRRILAWKALSSKIWSPDQRPYFFSKSYAQRNLSSTQQRLGNILRGFSFRQLAAQFNQDELVVAKRLLPLIGNGTILLREPQTPFDQLPKISDYSLELVSKAQANLSNDTPKNISRSDSPNNQLIQNKNWKIACVDDSPTILNEINRFLDNENVSVFTINNPVKALMQIIRIKPDLILLDVGMPNIDGYKLCSMIRNNSQFKETPIVMVTGNKGLIDRAKARLSGATDYMTKPFSQPDLLKMVFRYLN